MQYLQQRNGVNESVMSTTASKSMEGLVERSTRGARNMDNDINKQLRMGTRKPVIDRVHTISTYLKRMCIELS